MVCVFLVGSIKNTNMSAEKVLETMKKAGRPLRSGEIAHLSGLDKKEVEKAMKVLQKEGKIESPARCVWQPKQ